MRRMALLRNLEQSLSGLLEGTVGRVFRTEVRPTEIARKLAREMEINKRVSLSRTYAPTDYLVYLSPDDRARYAGVEGSIAEELGAYLLEHARRERLVLVRRPLVEFRTDQRLRLGEFGIEARTAPISAEEAPPRGAAAVADVDQPSRRDPAPREDDRSARRESASRDDRSSRHDSDSRYDDLGPDVGAGAPPAAGSSLGSTPASPGYEPPAAVRRVDDAPYEDPYAGDPFGGGSPEDAYGPAPVEEPEDEYAWEDPPRDDDPDPDPEPRSVYADDEPAPASASQSGPEASPDWLDPVDDWAAPPAPAPSQPDRDQARRPDRGPEPPAQAPGIPGAPWVDPSLRRPERPQFAPPVVPARREAAPAPAPAPADETDRTRVAASAPEPARERPRELSLLVDGTPHELSGDRVVLGRSRSADIVIPDASVSRQHLELRRDDRGWYAVDLGSTNGSELNGQPITEPRRLESGQRLKLGHAGAIIEVR